MPLLSEAEGAAAPQQSEPERKLRSDIFTDLLWGVGPWILGISFALVTPNQAGLPFPIDCISSLLGWIYFVCWSFSFYPQVVSNFRRKSVVGLSLDFQLLNLLGFACYSVYTCSLFFNAAIRQEYADQHNGDAPSVHLNDVFFAVHATLLTAITLGQCCVYERKGQRLAWPSIAAVAVLVAAIIGWGGVIFLAPCVECGGRHRGGRVVDWLTWLYFISAVKMAVTLVKYVPQVVLNARRRSTVGWNIWNVLLDFEGGVLSLAQLALDAGVSKDWTPVTGNPIKFGLGCTSMVFDAVFMVQHFWLYRDSERAYAAVAMDSDVAALEAGQRDGGDGRDRNEREGNNDGADDEEEQLVPGGRSISDAV
jgi:cystinosin